MPSEGSIKGFIWPLMPMLVTLFLGAVGTAVGAYFVYKYFMKRELPQINISTNSTPMNSSSATGGDPKRTTLNSWIENATVERFLNKITMEKPIRFTRQQLAGFTQDYTTRLGSGGFATVYKGKLPNGVLVAVKALNTGGSEDKGLMEQQFMAEIGTIGRTFHANLVRLYGFCYDSIVIALVYEYMDKGSLATYLFDKCFMKHGLPQINMNSNSTPTNPSSATDGDAKMTTINSWIEDATVERFLNKIAKEKPIRFTRQQLAGFTHNYTIRLGSGGFGTVYKGQLPNGVLVAVKVLNTGGSEDKRLMEQQFMAEIGTTGRTFHANLVRLYGFCYDSIVRALVYEYMDKGSLDTYLFDKNHSIAWEKLHEIAIGTAKALSYLHDECEQRIIHYDIKPANILLDHNFTPKVADFGLAKLCNRENTHVSMTVGRGTPGYAAPEMWMMGQVTHKNVMSIALGYSYLRLQGGGGTLMQAWRKTSVGFQSGCGRGTRTAKWKR